MTLRCVANLVMCLLQQLFFPTSLAGFLLCELILTQHSARPKPICKEVSKLELPNRACLQILSSNNPSTDTCEASFGLQYWTFVQSSDSFVDSSSAWHHLAVTWTAAQGMTKIYRDGLLIREVSHTVTLRV